MTDPTGRVLEDIRHERAHQMSKGWTPERDDHLAPSYMAHLAYQRTNPPTRHRLVQAAAILAAAIEAIDRRESTAAGPHGAVPAPEDPVSENDSQSGGRPSSDRDGPCTCDYGPSSTGPEEDCPHHGRPYAYWVKRGDDLTAELEQLRRWKAEALPVLSGLQELGKALDMRLGAVGPTPPTVEDVAAALRSGPRPFGTSQAGETLAEETKA